MNNRSVAETWKWHLKNTALITLAILSLRNDPVSASEAQGDGKERGRCLAVLVGVDKYDHLPSLRYCAADMAGLREQLWKRGRFAPADIITLTDGDAGDSGTNAEIRAPTLSNVRDGIKRMLSSVTEDDIVLFAFSGHGVAIEGKGYLCLKDTPIPPSPKHLLNVTEHLYNDLYHCKAGHKVLIIDACRAPPGHMASGRNLGVVGDVGRSDFQRIVQDALPENVNGLFSCQKGELSFERDDLKHGVFMKYVIQGLKGDADMRSVNPRAVTDGNIGIDELFFFASVKTREITGDKQTPQLVFRGKAPPLLATTAKLREDWVWGEKMDPPKKKADPVKFKLVRRGSFEMGCDAQHSNKNERPVRKVSITADFYCTVTEVTQDQFLDVMGYNPVVKHGGARHELRDKWVKGSLPVAYVSFNEAKEFCNRLAKQMAVPDGAVKLPTEAQWEYVARCGGEVDARTVCNSDALKRIAWFEGNSANSIHQVGSLMPNGWGFYDLQGNVAEWCEDAYDKYFLKSLPEVCEDPVSPWVASSERRVLRGGAWHSPERECRVTDRNSLAPDSSENYVGFRVVITPQPRHYDSDD